MQTNLALKTRFPVKIRDIQKIERKHFIAITVLGYEYKKKYSIYVSKKYCDEKHVDLLLIREEGQNYLVTIKDFNTFIYDHTLNSRKHLWPLLFTSF